MAKSKFAQKHFHDEDAARAWFEAARWPDGPVCPNCGSLKHYATKKVGRYRCGEPECRKDFTVQTKTVMERSHAPLTSWAYAFTSGAVEQERLFRAPAKAAAWLPVQHGLVSPSSRYGSHAPWRPRPSPMGGPGKIVEADETYFGDAGNQAAVSKQRRGRPFKSRAPVGISAPSLR